MNPLIEKAIKKCGGQKLLAEAIGKHQSFISQLLNGDRPIPTQLCIPIEKATDGEVRCEDLRPDVDWAYIRSTKRKKSEAA